MCYISIHIFVEYCEKKLASLTTEESLHERLSFDTKKLSSRKKNSLDIPLQRKLFSDDFGGCQLVICTIFFHCSNVSYKI